MVIYGVSSGKIVILMVDEQLDLWFNWINNGMTNTMTFGRFWKCVPAHNQIAAFNANSYVYYFEFYYLQLWPFTSYKYL